MVAIDYEAMSSLIMTVMGPFWVECVLVLGFSVGYLAFRGRSGKFSFSRSRASSGKTVSEREFSTQVRKTIETESDSGNFETVLAAWRNESAEALAPVEVLKLVVKAFLEAEPENMETEVIDHLRSHPLSYSLSHAMAALDAVARGSSAEMLESFWANLRQTCRVPNSSQSYTLLLGGYAASGDQARVEATVAEMQAQRVRRTAKAFSLTIKGFLKHGLLDGVLEQMHQMLEMEIEVPAFAVVQYTRLACEAGRAEEVFAELASQGLPLPEEAVTLLLEDCMRRSDLNFASIICEFIRQKGLTCSQGSQEALLKLYASAGDIRALEVFESLCQLGSGPPEGFCVSLMARCAESKFVRFAEEIGKFSRARGSMNIATISAMMKVYAQSGMYAKACDLYDVVVEEGLEPDAMMYGCLMKFAVECGRTELSRELSGKTPCMEIQNFMSLLRAAGRDKDANKALAVLRRLKASDVRVDIAAFNCALDAIVSAGDLKLAEELAQEIQEQCGLDTISYNTLLKGYCMKGRVARAREVLQEMEAAGHTPNDVSYNSVINAAVSKQDIRQAWEIIELMEAKGVAVDHFTVSIMMKSVKKCSNGSSEVRRILALLDRSGLDVTSDEVLLNMLLDTCIRHKELARLKGILDSCLSGQLRPASHTYGALIKACGSIRWVDKCRLLWQEMTEHRRMEPTSIVLGCMLDALVNNKLTDEAVALFRQWKSRVPPNSIMYSTLMKGFAAGHKAKPAMEMWREMCADKAPMNTVVYNAIIDAQARVGAMDKVSELVRSMELHGCAPDPITFSTIVKGYCVQGDLDAAFEVYRNMQRDGTAKDAVVCNTLLDGCTKIGRFDLADQLIEEMERAGIVPTNFTLGILAKMWGRRHRLDKAFAAMEELPKRWGFSPNAQVYACLMCACLSNNAVERAHQVFEESKRAHGADAKAYGTMISGCTRQQDFQRAVDLVREACGLTERPGLRVDSELGSEHVEQLLRALVSRGQTSTARELLQQLRSTKVRIGRQVEAIVLGHRS